ncbi:12785_t:CDS:1, partial [Racocetra fulgida]
SFRSAYIADLGLSTLANIGSSDKVCGIMPYIAPEVLYKNEYSKASDVYSFAIIAYEIVSGHLAYYGIAHDVHLARNIYYHGLRPSIPTHIPKVIAELITECWDAQPDKRP